MALLDCRASMASQFHTSFYLQSRARVKRFALVPHGVLWHSEMQLQFQKPFLVLIVRKSSVLLEREGCSTHGLS